MSFLIDSNIFIYAAAGQVEALDVLDAAEADDLSGYSAITRLEVIGYNQFADDEETQLLTMLSCFKEYDVSRSIIDEAIRLRKCAALKVPDAIIAATARIYRATLITRNTDDFKNLEDLDIRNPFA